MKPAHNPRSVTAPAGRDFSPILAKTAADPYAHAAIKPKKIPAFIP